SESSSRSRSARRGRTLLVALAAPRLGAWRGLAGGRTRRPLRDRGRGRPLRSVPPARRLVRPAWKVGTRLADAAGALSRPRRFLRSVRRLGVDTTTRRLAQAPQSGDDERPADRRRRARTRR